MSGKGFPSRVAYRQSQSAGNTTRRLLAADSVFLSLVVVIVILPRGRGHHIHEPRDLHENDPSAAERNRAHRTNAVQRANFP